MGFFTENKNEEILDENVAVTEGENIVSKENFTLTNATGDGDVQISINAIASIIRKEVLGVEDVIRLAPVGIVDGIADVFSKRNFERSIVINLNEGSIDISLVLVLRFGCVIRTVVNAIQANVKKALEELADIKVGKVNILVKDLEEVVEEEPEPADEAPAEEK